MLSKDDSDLTHCSVQVATGVEAVVDEVGVAAEGGATDIVVMGMIMASVVGTEEVAGNLGGFLSQLDLLHTLYYTPGSVNPRTVTYFP